jgi:hypothetical protein
MKQLGRMDRYEKELSKITRSKNIPSDWASPEPAEPRSKLLDSTARSFR